MTEFLSKNSAYISVSRYILSINISALLQKSAEINDNLEIK